MSQIKFFIDQLLHYIDNGKFFREPMKWLYIFNGIWPFIIPFIYAIFFMFFDEGRRIWQEPEGWTKVTVIIALILVFAWILALSYAGLVYWFSRKRHLNNTVRVGDNIVAIPIWAHYIQCCIEWSGIYLALVPIGSYIIGFACMLLSGFKFFYDEFTFKDFILGLFIAVIIFVIICVVAALFCYYTVFIAHLIGENMRIKAQMANDLRDLGDIHRAATMDQQEA